MGLTKRSLFNQLRLNGDKRVAGAAQVANW